MINLQQNSLLSLCVTEVSQAGAGIYKSLEGAGDLTEDKPYWVINTCLAYLSGELHRSLLVHETKGNRVIVFLCKE